MINNFLVFLFATVLSLPYTTSRNPGKVDSSICVLSCFSQGHTMFEANLFQKRSWNPHNFLIIKPLEDSELFLRRSPNHQPESETLDEIVTRKTPEVCSQCEIES